MGVGAMLYLPKQLGLQQLGCLASWAVLAWTPGWPSGVGAGGLRGSQPLCPPHGQSSYHWWERRCLPLILFLSSSIWIHFGFSANPSDSNR